MTETKKVVVCGDLVWDTHIARVSLAGQRLYDPHLNRQLATTYGGAWYLTQLIEQFTSVTAEWVGKFPPTISPNDIKFPHVEVFGPALPPRPSLEGGLYPSGTCNSYSIWEWKDAIKKGDKGIWRIAEFLGCQSVTSSEGYPTIQNSHEPPALLVIEDLGQGFAMEKDWWPDVLHHAGETGNSFEILVKGTPKPKSLLWKHLLKPKIAPRVTVVCSIVGLRGIGANVSRGMSWDRTVNDLWTEFLESGVSQGILAKCKRVVITIGHEGVAVFSRLPRNADERRQGPLLGSLQLERVVFDRKHLEGQWSKLHEGTTFGVRSAVTAAMASHMLMSPQPSTHISVVRGLEVARKMHVYGGGSDELALSIGTHDLEFIQALHTFGENKFAELKLPEDFFSAFPRGLITDEEVGALSQKSSLLLTDRYGNGGPYLLQVAADIVREGKDAALQSVPHLELGDFFTVDKEEIETINSVRALIEEYKNGKEKRPISIAVFGNPGSGKSFAIKQLAAVLFKGNKAPLEFNLSQFQSVEDLHQALHQVRDRSIQGEVPLVFWDEFDTKFNDSPLGWLKEFLAPMQDASFVSNGHTHPLGRCVFVFAGGTRQRFSEFDETKQARAEMDRRRKEANLPNAIVEEVLFIAAKGPDFVSRLRGYVNIKGPNASGPNDALCVIRRALQIRSQIERYHPSAVHPTTKRINIDNSVLTSLLTVDEFVHGSRSIEAIISLSHIREDSHFGPSELPPSEVLELHTGKKSLVSITSSIKSAHDADEIEELAGLIHKGWRAQKEADGYKFGETRNDIPDADGIKYHQMIKPYEELTDSQRDGNREPARVALRRLLCEGRSLTSDPTHPDILRGAALNELQIRLQKSEHVRWFRQRLTEGYGSHVKTIDLLRLHSAMEPWADLDADNKRLDAAVIEALFEYLTANDYYVVQPVVQNTALAGKTRKEGK